MRLTKPLKLMFMVTLFAGSAFGADSFYKVQPGDSLSTVLFRQHLGSVFGKGGRLEKAIALNEKIVGKSGARMKPGEIIRLPGKDLPQGFAAEPTPLPDKPTPSSDLGISADSDSLQTYVVEKGDTLIAILIRHHLRPVHGPRGSIVKTIALNQPLSKTRGELIWPGNVINLPMRKPLTEILGKNENPVLAPEPPRATRMIAEAPRTEPAVDLAAAASVPEPVTQPSEMPKPPKVEPPVTQAPQATGPKFIPFSMVEVQPMAQYSSIDGKELANSTKAKLLSNLETGIGLAWKQTWTDRWQSQISFKTLRIGFLETQTGVNLQTTSLSQNTFGLGASYLFSSDDRVGGSLEVGDQLFYRGLASGDLQIQGVALPSLHLSLDKTLIHLAPLSFAVKAEAAYFAASSYGTYTINPGQGIFGELLLRQQFENSDFDCGVFYGQRVQNTSILNLTQKDLGLNCGFNWRLH